MIKTYKEIIRPDLFEKMIKQCKQMLNDESLNIIDFIRLDDKIDMRPVINWKHSFNNNYTFKEFKYNTAIYLLLIKKELIWNILTG